MGKKGKKAASKGRKGKKGKRGKKRGKKAPKVKLNWRVKAMYGENKQFDMITNELKDIITTYKQTDPIHSIKQGVASALKRCLDQEFKNIDVVLVGSSSSNLAFDWSDVDVTVLTKGLVSLDDDEVKSLTGLLDKQGCVSQIEIEETDMLQTTSTINFHFATYLCGFRVHLSVNDIASTFHAYLLRTYNQIDNRLSYIVLPVKQWAYNHGLLNPKSGKLSGYLVTLMVIFYLQAGLVQPVLPSLQKSAEKLFKKDVKYLKQWKEMKAAKRLKVKTKNYHGLAELFLGFFVYYQQFDYDQFEIDIVTGDVRPRVLQDAKYKSIRIAIRDPFDDGLASSFITSSLFIAEFKQSLASMQKQIEDQSGTLEECLNFAGNTRREETMRYHQRKTQQLATTQQD